MYAIVAVYNVRHLHMARLYIYFFFVNVTEVAVDCCGISSDECYQVHGWLTDLMGTPDAGKQAGFCL